MIQKSQKHHVKFCPFIKTSLRRQGNEFRGECYNLKGIGASSAIPRFTDQSENWSRLELAGQEVAADPSHGRCPRQSTAQMAPTGVFAGLNNANGFNRPVFPFIMKATLQMYLKINTLKKLVYTIYRLKIVKLFNSFDKTHTLGIFKN